MIQAAFSNNQQWGSDSSHCCLVRDPQLVVQQQPYVPLLPRLLLLLGDPAPLLACLLLAGLLGDIALPLSLPTPGSSAASSFFTRLCFFLGCTSSSTGASGAGCSLSKACASSSGTPNSS